VYMAHVYIIWRSGWNRVNCVQLLGKSQCTERYEWTSQKECSYSSGNIAHNLCIFYTNSNNFCFYFKLFEMIMPFFYQ
jgi:hypothetical protein